MQIQYRPGIEYLAKKVISGWAVKARSQCSGLAMKMRSMNLAPGCIMTSRMSRMCREVVSGCPEERRN